MYHKPIDKMMSFGLAKVVLQPTTFCNINCKYCYLPLRNKQRNMPDLVTKKLSEYIKNEVDNKLNIIWHGGEPLSCGIKHFKKLLLPLVEDDLSLNRKVQHYIQTNGTLIDQEWCNLIEKYKISIGVSIDGPKEMSKFRVNKSNANMFDKIMKGINLLKVNNIPFSIISVITEESLDKASILYNFAKEIECKCLCVNIEEVEGVNTNGVKPSENVKRFWQDLYKTWIEDDQKMPIREFSRLFLNFNKVCRSGNNDHNSNFAKIDIFPSISSAGNVYLLSPEFMGVPTNNVYDLLVGNIIETSLQDILDDVFKYKFVVDYVYGLKQCKDNCPYFRLCGGGQASNRYFEFKALNVTETNYCRNSKILLTDAILELL